MQCLSLEPLALKVLQANLVHPVPWVQSALMEPLVWASLDSPACLENKVLLAAPAEMGTLALMGHQAHKALMDLRVQLDLLEVRGLRDSREAKVSEEYHWHHLTNMDAACPHTAQVTELSMFSRRSRGDWSCWRPWSRRPCGTHGRHRTTGASRQHWSNRTWRTLWADWFNWIYRTTWCGGTHR